MSAALAKTLRFMLDCEARRDAAGKVKVYKLPPADGGGSYEIAGINDRYNPKDAPKLRAMIQGNAAPAEVEAAIMAVYDKDTAAVANWTSNAAVEAWLRDAVFNRGYGGAAKMLQRALGVTIDGGVGPKTKAALEAAVAGNVQQLLLKLRAAAEAYERIVAPPVGARAAFWQGLVNRWDKRTQFALSLV